jgi:hypothetical protein
LNLADADLLVDARPLLGGGLRRSNRATNGYALLCCCSTAVRARALSFTNRRHAERRTLKIGSFSLQVNANAGADLRETWSRLGPDLVRTWSIGCL